MKWEDLIEELSEEERLITPDIYDKNPRMFDEILSVGWLIAFLGGDGYGMTFSSDKALSKTLEYLETSCVEIHKIQQLYFVRLAIPWNNPVDDFFISSEELDQYRKTHDIISVYVRVVGKDYPYIGKTMPIEGYGPWKDDWDIIEYRYLVRQKPK